MVSWGNFLLLLIVVKIVEIFSTHQRKTLTIIKRVKVILSIRVEGSLVDKLFGLIFATVCGERVKKALAPPSSG